VATPRARSTRSTEQARLTKGAVYYHFKNKRGLFEAVLRAAQAEIVRRIEERAIAAKDPLEAVVAGCRAFLDVVLDDELRQIVLVDGPAVLGWSVWRAIDGELGLGSLKEGLREAESYGALEGVDRDVLAHLISGALNEAVFLIAEAEDRAEAHTRVWRTLDRFLRSVLA
jgi:AcrR family transcriptional regulator